MTSFEAPQAVMTVNYEASKTTSSVQVQSTEISSLAGLEEMTPTSASPAGAMATKVLKIIEQYGLNYERTGSWDGFEKFYRIVLGQVSRGEPVKMLLPGFPFKSPNLRDKVLGKLPDLGEELALKHLNGLCKNIKGVYEPGAEVHITSDGLVYNDLLGVPDEDVWNFGEAVRLITVEHGLRHLSFLRLWDLLGTSGSWSKEHYLENASNIRQELKERYGDPQFEKDMANKSSSDMQMTHSKYLEFLKSDLLLNEKWLAQSPEEQAVTISDTAKAMMGRWKAFAAALEANRTEYVRLSIHDSGGKDKLSMALIPQKQRGALGATPWHSVVVAELDGSYRSVQRNTVDQEKYELIHRDGRPYFFRAKSSLFDWSADGCDVKFDHLYPTGLIVRPTAGEPSVMNVPLEKVRSLANRFAPIILRGFSGCMERSTFIDIAHHLGELSFVQGARQDDQSVQEIVVGDTANVQDSQPYSYFSCVSTPFKGNRITLFTSSRLFFRFLTHPWSVERLEAMAMDSSEKCPLIVRHPVTGEPCIQWQACQNEIKSSSHDFLGEHENEALKAVFNAGVYDQRSCLRFTWEKGDLLITDNVAALHTKDS